VLLPHLGDLDTVAMREQFDERLRTVASLYGVEHPAWVCDAHPDSYPRQWLRQRSELGLAVWHHHAHIAAATVEHGWRDREVLGVAWDGAGWGTDHTLWGGEFLLCHGPRWRRVAWLRPFALIGGDAAAREPLRSAVALLNQLPELTSHDLAGWLHQDRRTIERLQQAARSSQSVQTTSMGRLIDGIAALVLNVAAVDHEGAAALWWESLCDPRETGTYPWALHEGGVCELDWRPLLRAVLRDWRADVLPGIIAARFHRSLADLVRLVSASWPQQPVVLGGGVFQNRVLIEMLVRDWPATSPPLGLPGRIPPNDGGLAAGQLAVAASGIVS
jgi:hydrogenase maturation protein HypF